MTGAVMTGSVMTGAVMTACCDDGGCDDGVLFTGRWDDRVAGKQAAGMTGLLV
jgi:hypothetical protein